jgi:hypothetical protein
VTTTTGPLPPPLQTDRPGSSPPDRRGPTVTGLVLVAVGVLWSLHLLGVDLRWELVLPAALVLTGVALLLGGRSAVVRGLVPVGVVLSVLAVATVVTDTVPTVTSGAGDRDVRITDVADLDPVYELGAGDLTLDLRGLDLPPGVTPLRVSVGVGQLRVQVPADARLVVDADVGGGELEVLGTQVDGVGASRRIVEAGAPDAGTLEVEANVGLGRLEVTR